MAKIDRSEQEKTVKIGPWKVKLGTICIIGLVVIMMGSSLGYITSQLGKPRTPKEENQNRVQTQIIVIFDENNTFQEVVPVNKEDSAEAALIKVADIKTKDTDLGKILQSISIGNSTEENTQSNAWVMYINSRLDLRGIDRYKIQQGDTIIFKYEKNPF